MDQQHLDVAVEAARAGAKELMARRDDRVVSEKSPKDLVTDADLASQHAIRQRLQAAFPDYAFVGEEEGENDPPESVRRGDPDAPPCWVVDPLDGTVNYVHRLQSFAVSIALYARGKMRLGVILDPTRDELFTAIDGQGAQANGRVMESSDCQQIGNSLIACSFKAGVQSDDPEVGRFVRVLEQCRSLRRLGSCALNMCYVADGRLDAYWATGVAAWDSAAGTVIARESGAVLTAYNGDGFDDWNPKFVVAANTSLHQSLLPLLS
ncbi:inositol monophosphatase family protein [Crateriforma conspicua]|uniref:Inositol-1-monophosphatase n=1 Tax=Crateriforma conspicua TaxID=2527996 RepID=A0A5C5Y6Q0_9PLAN|nr:inositol monophosphatase family protein [Crateriforma conspicua]QDV65026.1 Inositol-1-monophosphatase [Crateriforma conspicua]TWT70423.1 Inositol-1-monophosphatase [Crateriforma conspicua]